MLRVAVCQLAVGADRARNVTNAVAAIAKAAKNKAELIVLPECFNCPYGTSYFPEYAERVPGPSSDALAAAAKKHKAHVIAGSLPERGADNKVYNTSLAFSPAGTLLAKHRKVHLFDINVPGGVQFRESDTLTAGCDVTVFKLSDAVTIGLGICYDIRFPEQAHLMRLRGANVLVYPGAFNMTTGPMHWELLARARAVDTQCYLLTCSPARDEEASYVAWGHSTVVDPWGKVVATTGHAEDIVYADLDLAEVDKFRTAVPTFQQRRPDIYKVVQVQGGDGATSS